MLGLGVQQCWIRLNMPLFIETEENSVFCGPERHQRSRGHKTWRWQLRGHKTQCRWIYAGLKWKLLLVELYWFSPVMHREFFKNSKSAPNHSKLSENCGKPFLSSKQLVSTDKNMFYQMLVKFWYPRLRRKKTNLWFQFPTEPIFFCRPYYFFNAIGLTV